MAKKAKVGRPSKYTPELADYICQLLAEGKTLIAICKITGMPDYSTIMNWLCRESVFKTEFFNKYTRARDLQADYWADEIIEVADDAQYDWEERLRMGKATTVANKEHIMRSHLRVESRKWIASKLKPKKYSDRMIQNIESDGTKEPIRLTITAGNEVILGSTPELPKLDQASASDPEIKD